MAASKQNKLDSLATKATTTEFRVSKLPNVTELTTGYGFKEGFRRFDDAAEQWRQNLERDVNKLIRAPDVSSGKHG